MRHSEGGKIAGAGGRVVKRELFRELKPVGGSDLHPKASHKRALRHGSLELDRSGVHQAQSGEAPDRVGGALDLPRLTITRGGSRGFARPEENTGRKSRSRTRLGGNGLPRRRQSADSWRRAPAGHARKDCGTRAFDLAVGPSRYRRGELAAGRAGVAAGARATRGLIEGLAERVSGHGHRRAADSGDHHRVHGPRPGVFHQGSVVGSLPGRGRLTHPGTLRAR